MATKDVFDMESNIEVPWNDSAELSVLGTCDVERKQFAILECDLDDLMGVTCIVNWCLYANLDEAATVVLGRDYDVANLFTEPYRCLSYTP